MFVLVEHLVTNSAQYIIENSYYAHFKQLGYYTITIFKFIEITKFFDMLSFIGDFR